MNKNDLYSAMKATVATDSSSIIADLMTNFDTATIAKFLTIFGGQTLKFPTIESVWRHYMATVIFSTLSVRDTKAVRRSLAKEFKTTMTDVCNMFCAELAKKKPVDPLIESLIAERVYLGEKEKTFEELKLTFSKK